MKHFLCFFALLLPFSSFAQDSDSKQDSTSEQEPQVQEQMDVWGTEINTSSVSLGDESMAVKQADHVSDLLRTIPGVDVGGAHSLNQRITIRSLGDRDLEISIDGAGQNSYMYHHMGNLQIHADILKAVDISVGNNSVVHGGLGGSVRFETKDAADLLAEGRKFGARLQAGYADNASQRYAASAFGLLDGGFDFLAYFNGVDRDNFEVGGGRIKDASGLTVDGTDGKVRGLEGKLSDTLFKLGHTDRSGGRLSLSYEHYVDEGDYSYRPDMGLATDLAIADSLGLPLVYPTEFSRDTLNLGYERFIGNTHLQASIYQNTSDLQRDESGVAAVFGGASLIEGEAVNSGAELLFRTVAGRNDSHGLTYGLRYNDYETEYHEDGLFRSSENARKISLFMEDAVSLGAGFVLTPGLRYDTVSTEATIIDDDFNQLSAALALEQKIGDRFTWRASATSLFKAPEIGEVFLGAGLSETPNPNIEAETGVNTELGLSYQHPHFQLDRLSFGLTLYRTDIEDYIYDYAPNPETRNWNDNVGDMVIEGWEAYIGFSQGDFSALLTHASAESDLSAIETYAALDGARLDRTQGDSVSLAFDYRLKDRGLRFHWDSLWVSDLPAGLDLDGATLNNAKSGYQVHNISLSWSPRELSSLRLTFGVDNLLDAYYASQSSRTGVSFHPRFGELYLLDYEPGRNVKATLAYNF